MALIYLLTWTGEADKQTHLTRRLRPGRAQVSSLEKDRPGARKRPGFGSAISVHGVQEGDDVQADEAAPAFTRRRAPPGRRAGGQVPSRGGGGQLGLPRPANMMQDEGAAGARARVARMPSGAGSPNLLASFAGKNRVLVISAPHDSDGYYRLMMSLLKPDVYCELAERHVHQIVMFHQEGEMGGKVRRITAEGKVMEEPLDTALIPRLMSFLKMEKGMLFYLLTQQLGGDLFGGNTFKM